jgi:site-specific DNA-methyltransferase (adenine-specific)
MPVRRWMRPEWQRSSISATSAGRVRRANDACGVANAATRKYLKQGRVWHWPPGQMLERLAAYATEYGVASGRPYSSLDGRSSVTPKEWDARRHT